MEFFMSVEGPLQSSSNSYRNEQRSVNPPRPEGRFSELPAVLLGNIGSFLKTPKPLFEISTACNLPVVKNLTLEGADHHVQRLLLENECNVAALPASFLSDRVRLSIRTLDLTKCKSPASFTNAKLKQIITTFPNLERFILAQRNVLTSEGLQELASCKNLRELDLRGIWKVDDAVLCSLVVLPLRKLKVLHCHGITNEGMKILFSKCKGLESFASNSMRIDISLLASLPNLRELDLSECKVPPAELSKLSACKGLVRLNISHTTANDQVVRDLAFLFSNLESLHISGCGISNDVLREILPSCTKLTDFASSLNANDETLRLITALPKLTSLNLDHGSFTTEGIKALAKSQSLTHLRCFFMEPTPVETPDEFLTEAQKIQKATVGTRYMTSIGQALASCRQLVDIDFSCVNLTAQDMNDIFTLPNLRHLTIGDCGLDDVLPLLHIPKTLTIRNTSLGQKKWTVLGSGS